MRPTQRPIMLFVIACVAIVTLLLVMSVVRSAAAGGVVADCSNDTQLNNLLAGGGNITFNCGTTPHTILITSQKSINAATTIDGGGKITLDGQNTYRLFDVGAPLTLRNITLTHAYFVGDGGAIINRLNGTLMLENSVIRNSTAITGNGGAIISFGPLTITNSLLEGNRAFNGGALYPRFSGARTVIVNSVLRDNHTTATSDGWGGAILARDGASVTINGSSIYNNTARNGSGIYNDTNSVLQLTDVTLSGNFADVIGGGIYNASSVTLTNVTLSGNKSTAYAGGIYNASSATLTNVTLSGNTASATGGGLYNDGTSTLTNVTIYSNTATTSGGGMFIASGSVNVTNTIVANSLTGGNCVGVVITHGINFSSDNSCSFGVGRDNVDVMLNLLKNNGGPTLTHMPNANSPVIDAITSGCPPPSTDQRGAKRPFDGNNDGSAHCDVGAVEYGAPVSVVYLPLTLRNYPPCYTGAGEVEPNDDYQNATGPLCSGRTYSGVRNGLVEDRDFFKFTKASGGTVTVNVTNLVGGVGGAQVSLYASDGMTRIGHAGGSPFEIVCSGTLPCTGSPLPTLNANAAGTYYIRILMPSGYGSNIYNLQVTFP